MTLSDISIKNQVFAVMLSAAMVVFGYLGYRDMGISQFPEIDFPVVNITTYWEGAPPEIVDTEVTDVIEDLLKQQIQTIPGVGGVMYGGLRPRNMRLWLDRDRLNAYGLDPL